MSETLFDLDTDCMDESAAGPQPDPGPLPPPRLRRPNRQQMTMRPLSLDELLPEDHDARVIWAVVVSWDLSRFWATIRARGEEAGRAATDPRLLIALWLYAATRGVASGRELDRLCRQSDPYRWLCGGVSLNSHTLSDFRVKYEAGCRSTLTPSAISGSSTRRLWTTC